MLPAPNPVAPHRCITSKKKVSLLNNGRVNTCIRYLQEIDERCQSSSIIMCIKGLVYLLSHNCHLNMDHDVLTAHCWSSSGDSVVPPWLLVIGVSRTLLKSNTTLRSHLVRPTDPVDPQKRDGVEYKIPCACGKVYIGKTGRCMHEWIKEHDRDIPLSQTQTLAVSEHANKTGHYPLWNEVELTETVTGPLEDFILTLSTGVVELRFLKCGYQQSHNITADHCHRGPLRNQFLPLTIPTMLWIKNPPTMSEECDTPITNNHSGTNSPTQ